MANNAVAARLPGNAPLLDQGEGLFTPANITSAATTAVDLAPVEVRWLARSKVDQPLATTTTNSCSDFAVPTLAAGSLKVLARSSRKAIWVDELSLAATVGGETPGSFILNSSVENSLAQQQWIELAIGEVFAHAKAN